MEKTQLTRRGEEGGTGGYSNTGKILLALLTKHLTQFQTHFPPGSFIIPTV